MNRNNTYFEVKTLVNTHKEAEFWAYDKRTEPLKKGIMTVLIVAALALVICSGVANSPAYFISGIATCFLAVIFAHVSNSRTIKFITKTIVSLFYDASIYEESCATRRETMFKLCELRPTIEEMAHSGNPWKEISEKAREIIHC